MKFLAVIIVMSVLQYRGGTAPWQHDGWFLGWVKKLSGAGLLSVSPLLNVLLAAGLPALLVAAAVFFLDGKLLGLPALLIYVAVLFYSLGRGNFAGSIDDYIESWQRGDLQGAYEKINQFSGGFVPSADNLGTLHTSARAVVFYRGFERLFAALFWFAVLGPGTALFYRLTFLYRHQVLQQGDTQVPQVNRILYWLEWIPVRLLGFSFCLLGNFVTGLQMWLARLLDTTKSTQQLLNDMGVAALCWEESCQRVQEPLAEQDRHSFMLQAVSEIKGVQALLNRSAVLWICVIALLLLVL